MGTLRYHQKVWPASIPMLSQSYKLKPQKHQTCTLAVGLAHPNAVCKVARDTLLSQKDVSVFQAFFRHVILIV